MGPSQTGQGEKIHDRFTFPQQLLMDRYLYANREQTRQLRSKEQSLQTTIANLRAAFEQYTRFNVSRARTAPCGHALLMHTGMACAEWDDAPGRDARGDCGVSES